jgi:hypothetical protein
MGVFVFCNSAVCDERLLPLNLPELQSRSSSPGGVLSVVLLRRFMIKIANGRVISIIRNTVRRLCSYMDLDLLDYPTWKVNNTNVGYNFPIEAECPVLGAKKNFYLTFESHNHRKERANSGEGQSH